MFDERALLSMPGDYLDYPLAPAIAFVSYDVLAFPAMYCFLSCGVDDV